MMHASASLSPPPVAAAGWLRTDFPLERRWGFTELVAYARRDLPPDPHDPHGVRFRAYARGVIVPPYRDICWLPPRWEGAAPQVAYWQAPELNAEAAGRMRHFAAFPRGLLETPVIAETVRDALGVLLGNGLIEPFRLFEPWLVGLHLVKLLPRADRPAESSPPWVHRDGEPYTFVILLDRHNVVGGVNVVCPPACATRRAAGLLRAGASGGRVPRGGRAGEPRGESGGAGRSRRAGLAHDSAGRLHPAGAAFRLIRHVRRMRKGPLAGRPFDFWSPHQVQAVRLDPFRIRVGRWA